MSSTNNEPSIDEKLLVIRRTVQVAQQDITMTLAMVKAIAFAIGVDVSKVQRETFAQVIAEYNVVEAMRAKRVEKPECCISTASNVVEFKPKSKKQDD